jgi:hypothetical protein
MSFAPDRLPHEPPATLADRKVNLVACLRESWNRGPREKPFDPERTWWLLELITAVMTQAPSTTARELREQALELGETLGKARKILARTIKTRSNLANQITWAWTWHATGGASAASILSGQTPTDGIGEQLRRAVDSVSALEAAANLVAQWNLRPRRKQYGSGRMPARWVLLLSYVYTGITGLQPTTTETGLFMDFIRALRDTFDIPVGDDAVHRVVKIALRHRKSAAERSR